MENTQSNTLQNKVAIVTGASRGIGRAIAIELTRNGATVVLAARTKELLEKIANEIHKSGGQAIPVFLNLEQESSIKALIGTVEAKLGHLDILVNNAGITHSTLLEKTTTEDWDRLIRVNARGPFILCREALPLLKKAPRGYIVNISSVVGVKGYAMQSAYTASKHAIRGMSIALAQELRDTNIRVHVLCPGGVDTDMVGKVRPDIKKDELIKPEEIAEIVLYLLTHRGNAVIDDLHIRRASAAPWF